MQTKILGSKWFKGHTPADELIVLKANIRQGYSADGKPTGIPDCIRVDTISKDGEEISFDLRPVSDDKFKRCQGLFGQTFSVADVVGLEDCKIYVYEKSLRVLVSAADICPQIEV